ncbi:MAG: DUF433 domain-containing protein [Dehalococcoidia bacterium]
MQVEDYFNFLAPDDIRLKGTRIGIETLLYEYIHEARTPEEIAARYDSVSLEQVYATILYYLHNKPAVDAYIADWLEFCRQAERVYDDDPPPFIQRLRALKLERQAASTSST